MKAGNLWFVLTIDCNVLTPTTQTINFLFLPCRYPTVLVQFHLNEGTGGEGLFRGGDGVIREILFRRPLTLSVLTERRVYNPYGLKGTIRG